MVENHKLAGKLWELFFTSLNIPSQQFWHIWEAQVIKICLKSQNSSHSKKNKITWMNFSTAGSGSLAHILEGCTTPEKEKKQYYNVHYGHLVYWIVIYSCQLMYRITEGKKTFTKIKWFFFCFFKAHFVIWVHQGNWGSVGSISKYLLGNVYHLAKQKFLVNWDRILCTWPKLEIEQGSHLNMKK